MTEPAAEPALLAPAQSSVFRLCGPEASGGRKARACAEIGLHWPLAAQCLALDPGAMPDGSRLDRICAPVHAGGSISRADRRNETDTRSRAHDHVTYSGRTMNQIPAARDDLALRCGHDSSTLAFKRAGRTRREISDPHAETLAVVPGERSRPDVDDPSRPTPDRGPRLRIEIRTSGSGALCRQLLNELPDWFGIEEAVDEYVAKAERATAVVAITDGREVGLLTLLKHTAFAAEIDVMAVQPDYHRRGVGRAMVDRAERLLVLDGVEYLQVKTLADTVEYEPYVGTRAFYAACGFRPLQVFPDLWDPNNPALQFVKRLQAGRSAIA